MDSTPPPPPVATNANLVDLKNSEKFATNAAEIEFSVSPSGSATPASLGGGTSAGTISRTALGVSYDASTKSYTVSNASAAQQTFRNSDRAATSNATVTTFQKDTGTSSDTLVLFNAGAGNPKLALTYTSYGAWQHIDQTASGVKVRTVFYNYGIKTQSGDMPRVGSATYQTQIDGQFADASGAYALAGQSTLMADFGGATVNFSMTPELQNVITGQLRQLPTLTGSGAIDFANAAFDARRDRAGSSDYAITMFGSFYGPQASEVGAAFLINGGPNNGVGSGALVGKR